MNNPTKTNEPLTRLLIVDDEPMILRSLAARFNRVRDRFVVVLAESGAAALAAFDAATAAGAPFDVVLTDMRMPGMNGGALLRALAERGSTARPILLSGYAEEALLGEARAYCNRMLTKPCPWPDLLAAIDAELGAERQQSGTMQ
jgi:CheY-like chemotaxis protein